jgi:hypothetical protein
MSGHKQTDRRGSSLKPGVDFYPPQNLIYFGEWKEKRNTPLQCHKNKKFSKKKKETTMMMTTSLREDSKENNIDQTRRPEKCEREKKRNIKKTFKAIA